jgi:hypothetical protein
MDTLLRASMDPPPDIAFPADVEALVGARRRARRSKKQTGLVAWLVLGAYGLAALIASVWILSHIDWPSRLVPGTAGVVVILLAMASPLLLLPRVSPFRPVGLG